MDLHHFYHIYADGQWHDPVSEHIMAMKDYGLYDNLKTFAIGLVGSEQNCNDVKNFLKEKGINYTLADQQLTGWEQVSQIPMWNFCQDHEGLMLYAHTKGASDPNPVNIRWRRSMCYWNVIRWADCVEKLKDHFTVGCHWVYPLISMPEHKYGNGMYAGTFYWARCEFMRTWMKPPLTHRHESEGWIGYKHAEKPFRLYDFTPYFPNTDTFYDDWISNPDFKPNDTGRSIEPVRV